nr:MAG TPA: hypothetical protein [Caudoviricetes sp.]
MLIPLKITIHLHGMGFGKQLNQHLILHSKVVMGKMLLYL